MCARIVRKYGYYCIVMTMSYWLNYPLLTCLKDFPLLCVQSIHSKLIFIFESLDFMFIRTNLRLRISNEKIIFGTRKKVMNLFDWKMFTSAWKRGRKREKKKRCENEGKTIFKGGSVPLKLYVYEWFSIVFRVYLCAELELGCDLILFNDDRISCAV